MRRIKIHTCDPTCVICLEIIDDKLNFIKLSCNHLFHANCIYQWREYCNNKNNYNKFTCPLCNKIVKINNK